MMNDPEPAKRIMQAKSVVGTPLVLVQWWLQRGAPPKMELGARFSLVQPNGRSVWSLDVPGDYSVPEDRLMELKWLWLMQKAGVILPSSVPSAFDLYFVKEAKRVSFAVTRTEKGTWKVAETARCEFSMRP